jgi:hypothetical protein
MRAFSRISRLLVAVAITIAPAPAVVIIVVASPTAAVITIAVAEEPHAMTTAIPARAVTMAKRSEIHPLGACTLGERRKFARLASRAGIGRSGSSKEAAGDNHGRPEKILHDVSLRFSACGRATGFAKKTSIYVPSFRKWLISWISGQETCKKQPQG